MRTDRILLVVIVTLMGCKAEQKPSRHLTHNESQECLTSDSETFREQCLGHTAEYTGTVAYARDSGYQINFASGENVVARTNRSLPKNAMIEVEGLIVDAIPLTIDASRIDVVSQPPPKIGRVRTLSPQEKIARNREMGAQALDEWDAAIRQNNVDIKQALAASAVNHFVSSSGDVRVDTYAMADGRLISCKTEVYPNSAPITSCDGEP